MLNDLWHYLVTPSLTTPIINILLFMLMWELGRLSGIVAMKKRIKGIK